MRAWVVVGLLLLAPFSAAAEAYVVLLDWQHGDALVGTTPLLMSPLATRAPFQVDACHRDILVDLLYDPPERGVDVDGVGEVFLQFDFLAEIWMNETLVGEQRIRAPSYGIPLGTTATAGPHELRLSLANGVNVSWDLRVRGHAVMGELACEPRIVVNEVEANPTGVDAGFEWIELYNAGDETADLSLWTVRAIHGAPVEVTLPNGVAIAPGQHLVVAFTQGQTLDNADEVVELRDAFGRLRDATPPLSDGANEGTTWQRAPDAADAWTLRAATPAASNGQAPEGP